jgi:hypothetical protein
MRAWIAFAIFLSRILSYGADNPIWLTNGPAIYRALITPQPVNGFPPPNSRPASTNVTYVTNGIFDHFKSGSLNHTVWTNLIAITNGRTMALWLSRIHPPSWPTNPPVITWNTNCLIYGMRGGTAISPCWENEGSSGQVPITALTRRHGYTRGHGMGPDGFRVYLAGKKVWFVATDDTLVEMKVLREVVRTYAGGTGRDYSILLFDRDLPSSIQPMRVAVLTNVLARYPLCQASPYPIFKTEQGGNVSAEIAGFSLNTWKGGDSGSPDMLPLPGELVFVGGRSTSGPSREMQADMDNLCDLQHLDKKRYQLQWVDLSAYPVYLH